MSEIKAILKFMFGNGGWLIMLIMVAAIIFVGLIAYFFPCCPCK